MKYEDGAYVLSTGRRVGYAGNGILGISPDGEPVLHSGYDDYAEDDFTPGERREIADAMIAAWNRWALVLAALLLCSCSEPRKFNPELVCVGGTTAPKGRAKWVTMNEDGTACAVMDTGEIRCWVPWPCEGDHYR